MDLVVRDARSDAAAILRVFNPIIRSGRYTVFDQELTEEVERADGLPEVALIAVRRPAGCRLERVGKRMVHVRISGDASDWHGKARVALHDAFDREAFVGLVEASLAFTSGRGYQVLRAVLVVTPTRGVEFGGAVPAAEHRDFTSHVKAVLERIGAPLAT